MEDLGGDEGLEGFKESTQIALIDCDTVAYAACVSGQFLGELLPRELYTDEEWNDIVHDPQYDEDEHGIWEIIVDNVLASACDHILDIQAATDTKSVELYFSQGKNFRHTVDEMYKANRKGTRYPAGLPVIKQALAEKFEGYICDGIEADDIVVYKKRTQPDDYVLCAIDKDVLRSVPGRHYNYYRSERYGIDPKWQEITLADAERFPYIQTLMGDSTDNIAGCPGIGPKKAEKALEGCVTHIEMWEAVVKMFKTKKLTVKDAIRTMRLVNMHQIDKEGKWLPWTPPTM